VVFRAFGAADALARARRLRTIAARRGLTLLIGADPGLAAACRADGVHLPERLAGRAGRLKAARPGWIVTAAAHSLPAVRRAARAGADAVVISPIFPSASRSAGRPIGARGAAAIARRAGAPVYGLGGVGNENAPFLKDTGLAGLAAVEGLASPRT
jgi:thiamine-phosphate pyrophosphorylase